MITLEQYKEQLKAHDWQYHNSDSIAIFDKGENNEKRLLKLAKDNREFTQAFFEEKAKNE
jgi:hypothetical protein